MDDYKVLQSELKYKGRIITVREDTIMLPTGEKVVRDIIGHLGAAAIICLDEDGEIILVKQYRLAGKQYTLELPAGCLEEGEDPLDCAKRELEEETGYIMKDIKYLTKTYTCIGFCEEIIYLYVANCFKGGNINLDIDEFITVEKYSVEEVLRLIKEGQIVDAKTIVGVLMYVNFMKNNILD